MPFYETQPIIYPLHRLLAEVLRGEVRVPRFQRAGTEVTWRPEQRGDLLDSIFRGFPIGTVLLWSTVLPIRTFDHVGGAHIEVADQGRPQRLILDGHQRLSTLVALLGPSLSEYRTDPDRAWTERWVFDVGGGEAEKTPSRDRFILLKPGSEAADKHIPLPIVLDRAALNEWIRKRHALTQEEIRLADALRDRFREYNVPVAALVTESLAEATESFKRINSSGTQMGAFHMVAALAYTDQFEPQRDFELVRTDRLEPLGWQDIDDTDILRVVAGLVRRTDKSQHPAKIEIDSLAKALQGNPELVVDAGRAIERAIELLRRVGVLGPNILPYTWQLIVLAITLSQETAWPDETAIDRGAKWFWRTTYGGVFAGVNSAVVDRATEALADMLRGESGESMRRDETSPVGPPSDRFDFRSARGRACLLNIARQQDGGSVDGPAHQALARGSSAVATLVARKGRACWFNLVVDVDPEGLKAMRRSLRETGEEAAALLSPVGIEATGTADVDGRLDGRRQVLLEREQAFVEALGLTWQAGLDDRADEA